MIAKNNLLNVEMILKKIPHQDFLQVADLGCGNFGFLVFPLAHLVGKKGKVYAVDIIQTALDEISQRARLENLPQVETVWSNLEIFGATKIEADKLDAALLINVLHQADKSIDMLKETIRMIKPGGRLIIVDWNEDHPFGPAASQLISRDKLKTAISKLKLELAEEFTPGKSHYGLVFVK